MSSYLNINKLHEEIEQRQIKRRMIYDTVLASINTRIQYTNSSSDKCYLFYPIPAFISGMPIRDRPACIQYVMEHLTAMGFVTRFVKPNYIYISWRHVKNNSLQHSTSYYSNNNLQQTPAASGYRLPNTGYISQSSPYTNNVQQTQHLMSFTDQVKANRSAEKNKMIAFEEIDEQFLAGNEHYNPNFQPGSIHNPPLSIYDSRPSHIMQAHRPYLDPKNNRQPEPRLSAPSQQHHVTFAQTPIIEQPTTLPTQQTLYTPQIKSVSFNATKGRSSRKPRESTGPVNLDDILSPKPTAISRVNSITPITPASEQQLINENNRINQVLNQFGSSKSTPSTGIPNDIIGTLL